LVTIQPGQQEVNVTIEIVNDVIDEPAESFCLFLYIPANASEAGVLPGPVMCAEAIILGE